MSDFCQGRLRHGAVGIVVLLVALSIAVGTVGPVSATGASSEQVPSSNEYVTGMQDRHATPASIGTGPVQAAVGDLGPIETEARGDVVDIPITGISGSNYVTVTLGTPDVGYVSNVTVRDDDGDGDVTVQWNSYTADSGQTLGDGTWRAAGSDTVVNQDVYTSIADGPGHVIATGNYDVEVTAGRMSDGAAAASAEAVGVVTLEQRSTDAVGLWTADEAVSDRISNLDDIATMAGDDIVEDDTIAKDDLLIVQITASGIEGVFESQGTSDPRDQFYGAVDEGALFLNHTRTDADDPNTPLETLVVSASETGNDIRVIKADRYDSYFVIHDTGTEDVFGTAQSFQTEFRIPSIRDSDANYGLVPPSSSGSFSDETAYENFDVVDASIDVNTGPSGSVEVQDATGELIRGTATLAAGSAVQLRLETKSNQPSPFLLTGEATVREDGTWAASFDFSGYEEGTEFTVDASHDSGSVASSVDGIISASPSVQQLAFYDQETRGELVVVDAAQLSEGGFVAIHEGGPLGPTLGVSSYLDPGEATTNLRIPLADPLEADEILYATVHRDTNQDGQFDYETSGGSQDDPYEQGGTPVYSDALIRVTVSDPTPTATITPSPTEPPTTTAPPVTATATSTDTPPSQETPTEESGGSVESFSFGDQTVTEDAVTLSSVELSEGGFVAIHRVSDSGSVMGHSEYLEPGERETNLSIPLEESIDAETTLVAVAHRDSNDNRAFDYDGPDGSDGPYTSGGDPISASASIAPVAAQSGTDNLGAMTDYLPFVIGGLVLVIVLGYGAYRWASSSEDGEPSADPPATTEQAGAQEPDPDRPEGPPPTDQSPSESPAAAPEVDSTRGPPPTEPREPTPDEPPIEDPGGAEAQRGHSNEPASGDSPVEESDASPAEETGSTDRSTPEAGASETGESGGPAESEVPPSQADDQPADTATPTDSEPTAPDHPTGAGDSPPPETNPPGGSAGTPAGAPAPGGADDLAHGVDSLGDVVLEHSGPAVATYSATLLGSGGGMPVQVFSVPPDAPLDEATLDAFAGVARQWFDASTHPNVRTVYEWATDPRPWIAVESLPGRQPITMATEGYPVEHTVGLAHGIVDALETVPALHGNLSPGCVDVIDTDTGPVAVVGDWGFERVLREGLGEAHVTAYTAPEQLDEGAVTDARTDVYGLAAVLYHALTGRPPVDPSPESIRTDEIPHPNEFVRMPPALDATIMHALSVEPVNRYATPADFGAALRDSL